MKCKMRGCKAEATLRGVCRPHYKQWWRLKYTDRAAHDALVAEGIILPAYDSTKSDMRRLAESLKAS